MDLREKKHLSGELGMSSMTDIIFILLIFFMMVSTLVHPSGLNLSLPGSAKTTKKIPTTERHDDIGITASGGYILNGVTTTLDKIKSFLTANKLKNKGYIVTISPDSKAPVEKVVPIIDATQVLGITAVLHADATE